MIVTDTWLHVLYSASEAEFDDDNDGDHQPGMCGMWECTSQFLCHFCVPIFIFIIIIPARIDGYQ